MRDIGAYKAMVTFDSKESLDEVMNTGKDLLFNHFAEVRKLDDEEWC